MNTMKEIQNSAKKWEDSIEITQINLKLILTLKINTNNEKLRIVHG